MYCCKCKKDKEKQFFPNRPACTNRYKGKVYEYFRCTECNTRAIKQYRETKKGKASQYKAVKNSISRYPDKQRARISLFYSIKNGKVIKASFCLCGNPKVEAHHEDYSKPLEVVWLCRKCHSRLHMSKK